MSKMHVLAGDRPFRGWWIKIFVTAQKDSPLSINNYRIIWMPLAAPDIDQKTGKFIEGKNCQIRKLAEANGYLPAKMAASTYCRLNHEPDLESIARRIIPKNIEGGTAAEIEFIGKRLIEWSNEV